MKSSVSHTLYNHIKSLLGDRVFEELNNSILLDNIPVTLFLTVSNILSKFMLSSESLKKAKVSAFVKSIFYLIGFVLIWAARVT